MFHVEHKPKKKSRLFHVEHNQQQKKQLFLGVIQCFTWNTHSMLGWFRLFFVSRETAYGIVQVVFFVSRETFCLRALTFSQKSHSN